MTVPVQAGSDERELRPAAAPDRTPAWWVVADRELRDLWVAGRGLPLLLGYSVLVGITFYLVATNRALNFLEQREAVSLTLQVAVAFGGLLTLLAAADAISGERERGTLESLLLTPVPRRSLLVGKAVAALSLWLAAELFAWPYLWFLGRGVGVVGMAVRNGLLVGLLLAVFLAGLGIGISLACRSNRVSLSVSLFCLLAVYSPTQLPTTMQNGWAGEALLRADPFTAALRYLSRVVVEGRDPSAELGWLAGPAVAAVLAVLVVLVVAPRLSLVPRGRT
jgi:ABC-2 type transport system permease protein